MAKCKRRLTSPNPAIFSYNEQIFHDNFTFFPKMLACAVSFGMAIAFGAYIFIGKGRKRARTTIVNDK